MKFLILGCAVLSLILAFGSCAPAKPTLPTVTKLDKHRYAGEWHEIARLPNPFEKDLVSAKATDGMVQDGTISVHNQWLKTDDKTKSIKGTAKPVKAADSRKLYFNPKRIIN